MKFVPQTEFHRIARTGQTRGLGVRRTADVKPRAYNDGTRRIRFCFSDGSVDRMGDVVNPNGWDVSNFTRNPVALWAHDSSAPPIGRASGITVEGERLMGDVEFAGPDLYAFADTIYRLAAAGFISAVSVGFLPIEYKWADEKDREWGIDFIRQELIEVSVVPVPANVNALVDARAVGIDTLPLAEWSARSLGRVDLSVNSVQLKSLAAAAMGRRASRSGGVEQRELLRWAEQRKRELDGIPRRAVVEDPPMSRDQLLIDVRFQRLMHGHKQLDPRVIAAEAAFRMR